MKGFTLLEVLVALVIVAFGMSAVLAALSSSAENISALREKTLAQWVALNQIADARLTGNPPQPGVTEGDVKNFGNGDWHWRRDVIAVDMIPGMLEIAVRVRRMTPNSPSGGNSGSGSTAPTKKLSGSSSGSIGSFFSSSGASSSGLGNLGAASSAMRQLGAVNLPNANDKQQWVATLIGFRGDSVGPPSGEDPDWGACVSNGSAAAPANCANSSSSGVSSSSGSASLGAPSTTSTTGTTTTTQTTTVPNP